MTKTRSLLSGHSWKQFSHFCVTQVDQGCTARANFVFQDFVPTSPEWQWFPLTLSVFTAVSHLFSLRCTVSHHRSRRRWNGRTISSSFRCYDTFICIFLSTWVIMALSFWICFHLSVIARRQQLSGWSWAGHVCESIQVTWCSTEPKQKEKSVNY